MAVTITYISAFIGLLISVFKDYLKVNKIWVRKSEQVVADSISISAIIIGMLNAVPYLFLVLFVYKDWLVTVRTLSDVFRAFATLLIGIGYWVETNHGRPAWNLFLQALKLGPYQKRRYEIMLVPHNQTQIAAVNERRPDLPLVSRHGGRVFVFDLHTTRKNVKNISKEYQALGLYVSHQQRERAA